ncbi:MAG: hypothetical protein PVF83_02540, partial [Anaerolineales bacterium]
MRRVFFIVFLMLVLSCFACSRQRAAEPTPMYEVSMTTVKEYGKSVDWLPEGNRIVTARPLYDEYYDVVIFSMD